MKLAYLATPMMLALSIAALPGAAAETLPPAVQALEKKGLRILAPLKSESGLEAYVGDAGDHAVTVYVTPDRKFALVGAAIDSQGDIVDRDAAETAMRQPLTPADWKQLEGSGWIADGSASAPRIVYVFTDPNCPYCAKLWADARPWVDGGKVQLRHVLVGILTPTSRAKAAALLTASNPGEALKGYESAQGASVSAMLTSGSHPRPLEDKRLQPLKTVPAAIAAQLDRDANLMAKFGLRATPGLVWKDAAGDIRTSTGASDSGLARILGPR